MRVEFRIQQVIDQRGTSQMALARDSGVSIATIHRLCRNTIGAISLDTMAALCATLCCEPGDLFAVKRR